MSFFIYFVYPCRILKTLKCSLHTKQTCFDHNFSISTATDTSKVAFFAELDAVYQTFIYERKITKPTKPTKGKTKPIQKDGRNRTKPTDRSQKWTKPEISRLQGYNTYTCKREISGFVRFYLNTRRFRSRFRWPTKPQRNRQRNRDSRWLFFRILWGGVSPVEKRKKKRSTNFFAYFLGDYRWPRMFLKWTDRNPWWKLLEMTLWIW